MLSSPFTSADLIPIGPAARIARDIGAMAGSVDLFRILSVTLPEELAATECGELRERLDGLGDGRRAPERGRDRDEPREP